MEFPHVGVQCAYSDCNRLDFLPLTCNLCKFVFCENHFTIHNQNCAEIVETERPKVPTNTINDKRYRCDTCNKFIFVPIQCEKCLKKFCIEHRHYDNCIENQLLDRDRREEIKLKKQDAENTLKKLNKEIEEKIKKAKQRGNETAKKIHIMKLKGKAKGNQNIPLEDRLYFTVYFNDKSLAIFIGKNWSIGRSIDAIGLEFNIETNQYKNSLTKILMKKLRLFHKDNGEILSDNMAIKINDLINSGDLSNGDELIINYIDNIE